jgi:hypothetical protein
VLLDRLDPGPLELEFADEVGDRGEHLAVRSDPDVLRSDDPFVRGGLEHARAQIDVVLVLLLDADAGDFAILGHGAEHVDRVLAELTEPRALVVLVEHPLVGSLAVHVEREEQDLVLLLRFFEQLVETAELGPGDAAGLSTRGH